MSCQSSSRLSQLSNDNLSNDEKSLKLDLKKQLKQQTRLRKLVVRQHQALGRHETTLAEQTQREIDELWLRAPELRLEPSIYDLRHSTYDAATAVIRQVHVALCTRLRNDGADDPNDNNNGINQAAKQLQWHMKKGTQTREQFDSAPALHGYTRNKFFERARLVVTSVGRLFLDQPHLPNRVLQERLKHKLQSVQSLASIGCGPGCDAVGMMAFLESIRIGKLETIILLDWAVDKWSHILQTLETLIVPKYVDSVSCAFCDVRVSLTDPVYATANDLLRTTKVDMYILSYLLSETRGKWQTFLDELVPQASLGTLFLISDPTAWQLHLLVERSDCCEWVWLDSSMYRPELQALEGRVSAAVVLGIKTE
jgi:hypothetical protein